MLARTLRFADIVIWKAAMYLASRAALLFVAAAYVFLTIFDFPQVVSLWRDYSEPHELIGSAILAGTLLAIGFVLRGDRRGNYALVFDTLLLAVPAIAFATRVEAGIASIVILTAGWLLALLIRALAGKRRGALRLVANSGLLLAILATFVTLYVILQSGNATFARQLGAVDLTLLFIGLASAVIAVLSTSRTASLVVAAICITGFTANHLNHTAANKPVLAQARGDLPDPFGQWLFDRADAQEYRRNHLPYPVFIVTSAGGGGYAAAHSFSFLTKTAVSCPNFIQHTFAMVGVSGGQVGNALFHANLPGDPNPPTTTPCRDQPPSTALVKFLASDNLAPVVGQLLFVELPEKLLFLPQTGIGRSAALMQSLQDVEGGFKPIPDIPFIEHLWTEAEVNGDAGPQYAARDVPAMIAVATNVESGNRFIFSPFPFETEGELHLSMYDAAGDTKSGKQRLEDPSLLAATVASASFPWVTPSVRLRSSWAFNEESDACELLGLEDLCWDNPNPDTLKILQEAKVEREVNLVDGGYFEGSGIETVSELVRHIMDTRHELTVAEMDDSYRFRSLPGFEQCETITGHFVARINALSPPGLMGTEDAGDTGDAVEASGTPSLEAEAEEEVPVVSDAPEGWSDCAVPFTLAAIVLKDDPATPPRIAPRQDFVFDPIRGLLNAQGARGELAVRLLEERSCAGEEGNAFCDLYLTEVGAGHPYVRLFERMYPSLINPAEQEMPLGWDMPEEATERFVTYVAPSDGICDQLLPADWEEFFTAEGLPAKEIPGAPASEWKNCFNYRQLKMLFEPEGLLQRIFWLS